jgi:ribonuclease HII
MRTHTLVGGDDYVPAIQAASILAKVHRDRWCHELDKTFPGYGFAQHKGYGTAQHQRALLELGVTPWHRRTFAPVAKLLALTKGGDQ